LSWLGSWAACAVPVLGLTDPRLCYLLDGFLFIYAVVITALFSAPIFSCSQCLSLLLAFLFQKLSRGHRDEYDVLGAKRGADPELGGRHQVTSSHTGTFSSLQKDKMGEAYSEIGMKGEVRRHSMCTSPVSFLFQGLSTATKDTYDALQMQPLPRR
uniref:T-cell surface glycoprotein CD3 zeta chain n=1 Tax=Strigops habroptila TaxID=2489341 RepID=A0A672U2X6_STRHB